MYFSFIALVLKCILNTEKLQDSLSYDLYHLISLSWIVEEYLMSRQTSWFCKDCRISARALSCWEELPYTNDTNITYNISKFIAQSLYCIAHTSRLMRLTSSCEVRRLIFLTLHLVFSSISQNRRKLYSCKTHKTLYYFILSDKRKKLIHFK